jgi:hypothetical protein
VHLVRHHTVAFCRTPVLLARRGPLSLLHAEIEPGGPQGAPPSTGTHACAPGTAMAAYNNPVPGTRLLYLAVLPLPLQSRCAWVAQSITARWALYGSKIVC